MGWLSHSLSAKIKNIAKLVRGNDRSVRSAEFDVDEVAFRSERPNDRTKFDEQLASLKSQRGIIAECSDSIALTDEMPSLTSVASSELTDEVSGSQNTETSRARLFEPNLGLESYQSEIQRNDSGRDALYQVKSDSDSIDCASSGRKSLDEQSPESHSPLIDLRVDPYAHYIAYGSDEDDTEFQTNLLEIAMIINGESRDSDAFETEAEINRMACFMQAEYEMSRSYEPSSSDWRSSKSLQRLRNKVLDEYNGVIRKISDTHLDQIGETIKTVAPAVETVSCAEVAVPAVRISGFDHKPLPRFTNRVCDLHRTASMPNNNVSLRKNRLL